MLSPVWIPIGSKFSIEQTITALSAQSRITSISNSFHPMMLSSIKTEWIGLSSSRSGSHPVKLFTIVCNSASRTS